MALWLVYTVVIAKEGKKQMTCEECYMFLEEKKKEIEELL